MSYRLCLSICRWNVVFLLQNFTLAYMRQISEMVRPFLGLLAFWRKCLLCNVFTLRGGFSPHPLSFHELGGSRRIWERSERWILLTELCGSSMARSLYFPREAEPIFPFCFTFMVGAAWRKRATGSETAQNQRPKANLDIVTGLIKFY